MKWGIVGIPVADGLPYSQPINKAANSLDFPPLFAYAIAYRETIQGEVNGSWTAATVVSPDNGHGLFQLTSSWPTNWQDPFNNSVYAIKEYLLPAVHHWHGLEGYYGDALIRLVAATFNEGLGAAEYYHSRGDVDRGTTNHYAEGVFNIYTNLVKTGKPA